MEKSISKLHPDHLSWMPSWRKKLGNKNRYGKNCYWFRSGFEAGKDVHAVVETKRGHFLGVVYYEGKAIVNTGIPGVIGGYGKKKELFMP